MLASLTSVFTACLALATSINAHKQQHEQQEYLGESKHHSPLHHVVHALEKAEVIPTVLDSFKPQYVLTLVWPKGQSSALGNTIKPKHMKTRPRVATVKVPGASGRNWAASPHNLVLTMTDPDAPSRASPTMSEICHAIVHFYLPKAWPSVSSKSEDETLIDIDLAETDFHSDDASILAHPHPPKHMPRPVINSVVEYKRPGPPPRTGKHRYVFTLFVPANVTSDPLMHLTVPKERPFWGTGHVGGGVRQWAEDNELIPVAANFVYSQHKKQKILSDE